MATTQMTKALADHLDQIAAICARHGVARLYAFGSAVRDGYREGDAETLESIALAGDVRGVQHEVGRAAQKGAA